MTSTHIPHLDELARRYEEQAAAWRVAAKAWTDRYNHGHIDHTLRLLMERSDFLSRCAKDTGQQLETLARLHGFAVRYGTFSPEGINLDAVTFRRPAIGNAVRS